MLLHNALAERQQTGKYRGELTGRRGGTTFPIEISISVFKTSDGHKKISSTVRDITEQKRAQEQLKETNALLKVLSDTDPLTHISNRRHLMATASDTPGNLFSSLHRATLPAMAALLLEKVSSSRAPTPSISKNSWRRSVK